MVRRKELNRPGQILTLFVVAIAIIVYCVPRLSDALMYDRQAILSGELWRLLTAPIVHFTASHLFWDVVVFGVAGLAVNGSGFRGFWMVCALGAVLPGLAYLLSFPELERYGGLSGLATGAVAYFCLCHAKKSKRTRVIWLGVLVAMGTKIMAEAALGSPVFAQPESIPFQVLPSAHMLGFLGAAATIVCFRPKDSEGSRKKRCEGTGCSFYL